MPLLRIIVFFLMLMGLTPAVVAVPTAKNNIFRAHLFSDISSLSPAMQKNSNSFYLLSQVYMSLLRVRQGKILPGLAEKCVYNKPTQLQCFLKKNLKFSDGSAIRDEDFKRGFEFLLSPDSLSFQADLLFPVKGAQNYFEKKGSWEAVGINFSKNSIVFNLEKPDLEFIYNLTSPLLAPQRTTKFPTVEKASEILSSGPYIISEVKLDQIYKLKPNPHFYGFNTKKPYVEFLVVPEDNQALQLYEKGELSFLRRAPTILIPQLKKRTDYHAINQFRFDYVGFGPRLQSELELRKALTLGLEYDQLQKIFSSEMPPGCLGIPENELGEKVFCFQFNLNQAKEAFTKAKQLKNLSLKLSKLGGDDNKRAAEWLQAQWQKNLKLTVSVKQVENKVFVSELTTHPPDLFRRGLNPSRPTCLSVLEVFETGNSENYIQHSETQFDEILKKMRVESNSSKKKNLCKQGFARLTENYRLIPLGPIHFSLLAKPYLKGWALNELNQLDLSELEVREQ